MLALHSDKLTNNVRATQLPVLTKSTVCVHVPSCMPKPRMLGYIHSPLPA